MIQFSLFVERFFTRALLGHSLLRTLHTATAVAALSVVTASLLLLGLLAPHTFFACLATRAIVIGVELGQLTLLDVDALGLERLDRLHCATTA